MHDKRLTGGNPILVKRTNRIRKVRDCSFISLSAGSKFSRVFLELLRVKRNYTPQSFMPPVIVDQIASL